MLSEEGTTNDPRVCRRYGTTGVSFIIDAHPSELGPMLSLLLPSLSPSEAGDVSSKPA